MHIQKISLSTLVTLFFLCAFSTTTYSQTNLVIGQTVTANAGTPQDYIIPLGAGNLEFVVRGGSGGSVRFSGVFCDVTVKGGGAAVVYATYEAGNGAGQLKPGGRIRAIVGEQGWSKERNCGAGEATYAGGGGSSAILYLPPGADPNGWNWELLAVAGGGGGASRPSSGIDRSGGGATASDPSGGSNGIGGASGGETGNVGTGNSFIYEARPGSGLKRQSCIVNGASDCFRGFSMVDTFDLTVNPKKLRLAPNSAYYNTGGRAPAGELNFLNGGNGFSGGGTGSTNSLIGPVGGGGGGGYSGGSVNYYFGGGGGSSYYTTGINNSNVSVAAGSNGGSNRTDGVITIKTIQATIPTVAVCQNQTVQLGANGTASLNVSQIGGNSTGYLPLNLSVNGQTTLNYNCADVGTSTVTLNLSDALTNTSSCTATITVVDNLAPTASCQDVTIELNASGNAMISHCSIDAGSTDNCGSFVGYTLSQSTFNCNNIGSNTVTMTVTDVNGNTSTCTSTVTVQDNMGPTANCKNATVQLDASGTGSLTASDINNGSSDICGIAGTSLDKTSFDCTNLGSNTVILTVTDNSGNTSTCSSTVSVQESIAPMASCVDVTAQLDANGMAFITAQEVNAGSTDNCGIASVTLNQNNFNCSQGGSVPVTLMVTDHSGNTGTCTANVTIQDNVPPVASCQDITVQLGTNGAVVVDASQFNAGSTDNCGLNRLFYSGHYTMRSFTCSDVGTTTLAGMIVEDVNGLQSFCDVNITVEDDINPTVTCKNIEVQLDANGTATIAENAISNGASDVCGVSFDTDVTSFGCADVGTKTLTLTASDPSGNTASCTGIVTIVDNIAPTANCTNVLVTLDENGTASINEDTVNEGSTDACGIASYDTDITSFDCSNLGNDNVVVMTVTDNHGNTSSCTATIIVEDPIAPTVVCNNPTITFNGESDIEVFVEDLFDSALSSDNCGSLNITQPLSGTIIDCSEIGNVIPVVVSANDGNGNTSTCTANITVTGLPCGVSDLGGIGCSNGINSSSYDVSTGTYTLTSNNCAPEMPYTEDRMAFVSQELCGNGQIVARVSSVNGTGYAGVTMRDDLTPGSRMVSLGTNGVNFMRRQVRVLPNYPSYPQAASGYNKYWIKMVRTGNQFQAYASPDGVQWQMYLNQYVAMENDCIYVGLFAYNEQTGSEVTATFDNVSISTTSSTLNTDVNNTTFGESLNDMEQAELNVFPNPAGDFMTVDLGKINSEEQIDILLFNNAGQQVRQRIDVQNEQEEFQISDLDAGTYNVIVKIGKQIQSKKLIVVKK